MNALNVLETAARIERKVADIYAIFNERFKEESEAALLWESLVMEEEAHAGFLDAKIRMLKVRPETFGDVAVDGEMLEDSLKKVEALEAYVSENDIGLEEAVRIALNIEQDMVEKKYNKLVEIGEPELKKIFDHLTKEDDHVEKLVRAAKRLGICLNPRAS